MKNIEQKKWWREIMFHCEDISILDRDFARCRHERPYPEPTFECCFEKCPKRLTGDTKQGVNMTRIGKAPERDCYGEKPVCPVCGISSHQRVIFEHEGEALDEIQCQKCKATYHW